MTERGIRAKRELELVEKMRATVPYSADELRDIDQLIERLKAEVVEEEGKTE